MLSVRHFDNLVKQIVEVKFLNTVDRATFKSLLLTLTIGFSGALGATIAGLPAAPLIGASISVSIAAFFKLTIDIPFYLRNVAFAIIGCSLGSGLTKQALAQSAHWPVSLLVLSIAVLAILFSSSWILCRFFSQSAETAVLATSPGALAYSLAVAAGGVGDIRTIMVIQNIRVLLVTTLLPLILDSFGLGIGSGSPQAHMNTSQSIIVILIAVAIGVGVIRWKIPASFLLAGMLVSGIGHYLDLIVGRPPSPIVFIGFAITGSMVGARFSSIPRNDLRRLLLASLSVALVSGLLALAFAYPVSALFSIPYGQVFTAFAPGGVEAMAAMAIALGYDPAYVATHHLFRILLLFLVLPLSIKLVRKTVGSQ